MPRSKPRAEPLVELPEHIHLTEHELSAVARLTRAMRNQCLVGLLVEYLLYRDANDQNDITIEDLEKIVCHLKNFRNWTDWMRDFNRDWPMLARYGGLTSHEEFPDVCESEENAFHELVTLWRKDHPEPEKPRQVPSGHLGQKESGD
jgi:hypothetical protein